MMVGRRIPIPVSLDVNDVMWDMRAGDYCGPLHGYTADKPAVFYVLPGSAWPESGAGFGHVTSPPHVFAEQADGSLQIRESIGHHIREDRPRFAWHGYLDTGHVWREC